MFHSRFTSCGSGPTPADAGLGFHPVSAALEARRAQYAGTARLTLAFKRLRSSFSRAGPLTKR
jgi:hypothetical protein